MHKIRLGVIGTGLAWERLHWPALQQLQDKYEVVAVCDTDIAKAQAAAAQLGLAPDNAYNDHRVMLRREDIDTVDVLVPIPENFDVARDVIPHREGLHRRKAPGCHAGWRPRVDRLKKSSRHEGDGGRKLPL